MKCKTPLHALCLLVCSACTVIFVRIVIIKTKNIFMWHAFSKHFNVDSTYYLAQGMIFLYTWAKLQVYVTAGFKSLTRL